MKCPNCGSELEEEQLLCENCGYEVKIVPDFDIELEDQLKESISSMMEEMADDTSEQTSEKEFDDCFAKKFVRLSKLKIVVIALVVLMVAAGGITAFAVHMVNDYRYNSFDYQYDRAVVCAAHNNYSEAVSYLERALAIRPRDLDARFLLAKYYEKNGQQQSTISLLGELLDIDPTYENRDEVYDMLLGIYEAKKDYVKMSDVLAQCDIPRIVSKYNKYIASEPVFNKQGGVYEELISISLKGNTQGLVHYTLDGTTPTADSPVYETPILLEPGEYTIKAIFINMYGIESAVETQHYFINLSMPDDPVIDPASGNYKEPALIEVYRDYGTKVYYTTDGSAPNKDSLRYTDPIEMPYGISNFKFIAIDESGLTSKVVNRTYNLNIEANFDIDFALQVLRNNLWADGKLSDVDGHVPNKPGINQYKVRTLFKKEDAIYYIIYEEYVDITGEVRDTNDIYALNVNTGDLYQAYKVDEGKYNLELIAEAQ